MEFEVSLENEQQFWDGESTLLIRMLYFALLISDLPSG
jgi:hypothetical protein